MQIKEKDVLTKIKVVLFVVILLGATVVLNYIFKPKDLGMAKSVYLSGSIIDYSSSSKLTGFYGAEEPIDIVFMGNSHVHCDINPVLIWEEYGVTAYNFSADQQDIATSYYYVKEMFKYQSPKVVVLNISAYAKQSAARSMHYSFDFMKPSLTKIMAILHRANISDYAELLNPFVRYHSRWKELSDIDFEYVYDEEEHELNGFWGYTIKTSTSPAEMPETYVYHESFLEAFEIIADIDELCSQNGAELVISFLPTAIDAHYGSYLYYIEQFAREAEIPFLNYYYKGEEIGVNYATDMSDYVHMNIYGSEKITRQIGADLLSVVDVETEYTEDVIEKYDKKVDLYYHLKQNYEYNDVSDFDAYISSYSSTDDYVIFIVGQCYPFVAVNESKYTEAKDGYSWSYISVIDSGKCVYEKVDSKEMSYSYTVQENEFELISTINKASVINCGDNKYANLAWGLNVVVYDKVLGEVVGRKGFELP